VIEDVREDADRTGVQRFLQGLLPDIAHNAVPMSASDGMYAPVVVRAVRDDGQIVGATLSCRAQVAAMASAMPGRALPGLGDFGSVMDVHSELDLLAVAPEARGQGVGSALMSAVEARLRERGVRWWFGNVTPTSTPNGSAGSTAGTASTSARPVSCSRRCWAASGSCPARRRPRSTSGGGCSRASAACRSASMAGANARSQRSVIRRVGRSLGRVSSSQSLKP
jgi:GNAT superfamily N-acetyltransferase